MRKRLAIIGAGDLGQLIAHHAAGSGEFEVAGFLDDSKPKQSQTPQGMVLGPIDDAEPLYRDGWFDCLIIGIGYRHFSYRRVCFAKNFPRIPFATLVHSSCSVDSSARIGAGSVLLPGCVVDKGVTIEPNTLLNTGCTIAHDTTVAENCFLGPGVTLAGFVTVESGCFIGVGTTVIDGIRIARDVQTGGGAVVVEDLEEPGLYVGVPAKRIRKREPLQGGGRERSEIQAEINLPIPAAGKARST